MQAPDRYPDQCQGMPELMSFSFSVLRGVSLGDFLLSPTFPNRDHPMSEAFS